MSIDKQEQKRLIIEITRGDEELGLYNKTHMTVKEIREIAEKSWEGCHGCDEYDKGLWINGFVTGYLNASQDNLESEISKRREKIADMLINPESYEQK
jgi:hypothetical protein